MALQEHGPHLEEQTLVFAIDIIEMSTARIYTTECTQWNNGGWRGCAVGDVAMKLTKIR